MTTAIDFIMQVAPDFGATCIKCSSDSAVLELPVQLVDGRVYPYRLQLRCVRKTLSAREETPTHLPAFCPERHINRDGTFCLSYDPVDRLDVTSEATALAWMETVYKFLKLQDRAKKLRRWPNNDAWAHGSAAQYQLLAQTASACIGKRFTNALVTGQLKLKRRKSNARPILEVWLGVARIYKIWESNGKVINQKRNCFCGSSGSKRPKKIRGCGMHAKHASDLAFALRGWETEEDGYRKIIKDETCCGTCQTCPLNPVAT